MGADAPPLCVKVCIAGPTRVGKSYLCKLLAETTGETMYRPTVGVRIQEIERHIGGERLLVQLWDCSGDARYQAGWPALARDMHGLILAYNPDGPSQEAQLQEWFKALGAERLTPAQVLILALKTSPGLPRSSDYGMQGALSRVPHETLALPTEDARDVVLPSLLKSLDHLLDGVLRRRREAEEQQYLG